ncbi:hypothetical protein N7491_001595 [Penicillium cf. griseofulvum]|uniref:Uncharacterized protein n=1 Tax=Penicillium cf. griseofulvum TaxID=2972120 RepID=A0A9W9MA26_9EURO|nr:hypothetical protein N7472_006725 [Penicillium cf. griseofulvum]KAJ5445513.1 hypothetical protein N7491_001595 [Penicillium cf. griseofulvum]KAJ5447233.1 hypothetical protein N7445_002054 [Penicillium cf. griseofulvum]
MGKVKWDEAADHTLLATIIQSHHLRVDAAKVAEAWPVQDEDQKPTPRAIKERLIKIKEKTRARNPSAATSGTSSPVTPKKRTLQKKADDASAPAGPPRKRKRAATDAAEDDEDVIVKKDQNLTAEDNEPLADFPVQEETDTDNGKGDAAWTEDNEDPDSDSPSS